QGNDYWTGPLSTVTAEISAETCREYDRHFETSRDDITTFAAWYEAGLFDAANGTNTQQEEFPNYQRPRIIDEWPAHGRNFDPYNEDFNLAPFIDRNGDGFYNPTDGDYPAFDLTGEADCRQKVVNLFGDQNLWWVFNDKGNIHTETGGEAIGMEIRAQAFAFATNDEVNNMTFYNYELINRSTFTLTNTYFGQWVDADLGNFGDDYVGCDVERGLGYAFNGDQIDEDAGGAFGYGENPPAIGVDFFQGPFQDADGADNPGPTAENGFTVDCDDARQNQGIPYRGIGVGYGDGIIDNERFGMRKFLYHNAGGGNPNITDPNTFTDYYNYLRSIWLDGSNMKYGGIGHDPANPTAINADYMFPDNTDPLGWGTDCVPQEPWTEVTANNTPGDRRFAQSAGPFTLAPGAVNNITVGVVWARANAGGPQASVAAMRRADDKTQALFDNCFRILNGPDAPDVTVQELDRELILYLSNRSISNNFNEEYEEVSPFLIPEDSVDTDNDSQVDTPLTEEERRLYATYKFQGYQIFQLRDGTVGPDELRNPDRAQLVRQVDIEDNIGQLVNFTFNEELGGNIPQELAREVNEGVKHSFRITEDLFATGDRRLINHRQYYFMAVAYGYNKYGDDFGNLQFVEEEFDPR
ncbi:MAG: T9SS C-terminal target domain-containing protein, partial [Bacteroidota bacterium]